MSKRILAFLLALIFCLPAATYTANGAEILGFDEMGWVTDTNNEYYINTDPVVTIYHDEVDENPYFGEIYTGCTMYVPIYVYANRGRTSTIATSKQISTDKVEVDAKVTSGSAVIGEVSLIDGKKLKNSGLEAGAYIAVPFTPIAPLLSKRSVKLTLVLSVKGIPFQNTRVTFSGTVINRSDYIDKNSVYGVEIPMKYVVRSTYKGEVTFNFGSKVKYTSKVKSGEQFYLALDRQPNSAITDMYSASGVYLDFYNFPGTYDTFSYEGKLEIPVDRSKLKIKSNTSSSRGSRTSSSSSSASSADIAAAESLYVYRIADNSLVSLSGSQVSFNSKTNVLTINTKALGSYVLSNQPLKKTVDSETNDILKSGYAS